MKILFLCHRFPYPPEGGGKIRALQMVRHLASLGHDVTLCSLFRSAAEERGAAEIRAMGVNVDSVRVDDRIQILRMLSNLVTSKPSSFGFFHSRALARRIDRQLSAENWDLIVAHCSSMGPYVSGTDAAPKLMDFADMDSQKWMDYSRHKRFPATLVYALEGRKLESQERRLARAFDFCTTISQNELETLETLAGETPSDWFPNGVDLEYFTPAEHGRDPGLIVFIGRMDYYPNEQAVQWFCHEVWGELCAANPGLKFRIVGANPSRATRRLAQIDNVEVTGFVDDVRPHVRAASVSVAPLRIARGMQNKVLECMAMGIPVVTTRLVASGLGLDEGSPLRLADTPEAYVGAVLSLLRDEGERARLASASRNLVEDRFSWARAMKKLEAIIDELLPAAGRERSRTAATAP